MPMFDNMKVYCIESFTECTRVRQLLQGYIDANFFLYIFSGVIYLGKSVASYFCIFSQNCPDHLDCG